MAIERTFSIVKPDAVAINKIGAIYARFEDAGLKIIGSKMLQITREQAAGFYAVHKERPFFNDLVAFMTSGPIVLQVLEGENAVARNREVMGATNPAEAAAGTVRAEFADTAIMKSLDDMRKLLAQENTEILPSATEDLPTTRI